MSYKRKRMNEIAEMQGETLDIINKSVDQLSENYGIGVDWSTIECPDMDVFVKNVSHMIEELRDYYVVSETQAERYLFDALRLRERGKI